MRNSVFFKFIALLLCAVSLLGVVGSGAGILILSEAGLYEKTEEQLYQEELDMFASNMAYAIARDYADRILGGCTDQMMDVYDFGYAFERSRYGYALLDAEGNELSGRRLFSNEEVTTYTYPVSGQYMYLVKLISESQSKAEEAQHIVSVTRGSVQLDMIPAEGCEVYGIDIRTLDGSSYFSSSVEGIAFRNEESLVVLRCPAWVVEEPVSTDGMVIASLALWDKTGELVYLAEKADGIGTLRVTENGESLIFESYALQDAVPEETGPLETIPEAPPEDAYATSPMVMATEVALSENLPEATGEGAEDQADTETTEVVEATAAAEETSAEEQKEEAEETLSTEAEAQSEEDAAEQQETAAGDTEATQPETANETTEATVPETEPAPVETLPEETVPQETLPPVTEPVMINGKRLDEYQINRITYWDEDLGEEVTAKYVYLPMPEMTVKVSVLSNALSDSYLYNALGILRDLRSWLLPTLGISLLVLAMTVVYLCCAAGREPKCDTVQAGGLNRIPIDLYLLLAGSGVTGSIAMAMTGGAYLLRRDILTGCVFGGVMAFFASLLTVAFCFALVAQGKTSGGFWWRNSLMGRSVKVIRYLWRLFLRFWAWFTEKLSEKLWPLLGRLLKWAGVKTLHFFELLSQGLNRFGDLLPLTWQWLLTGGIMLLLLVVGVLSRSEGWMVLFVCLCFAVVLYGAHCFGTLMEATKKMNKGNLNSKVDDKMMIGAFKTFAGDLNDLADVAVVAAQKQLKSERMKTELITNVSHDIKTPLTSIINYVDLMQKPHTQEEQAQYLEVLDRQSQRLKKLIDDLMDMSKASTGNMAVDITLVDAVESVNQALGEFADKLERADIYPVFRHTDDSVEMMADGRLVWRVLSNLLGNAVKYAMPGTRLYIDLMRLEGEVVISLKNISRDELNVDAEELMERFVRGDDSRNTEGSGLGLNIAKSLMELQKGQLQLLVDGDLFKVTLIFPCL